MHVVVVVVVVDDDALYYMYVCCCQLQTGIDTHVAVVTDSFDSLNIYWWTHIDMRWPSVHVPASLSINSIKLMIIYSNMHPQIFRFIYLSCFCRID